MSEGLSEALLWQPDPWQGLRELTQARIALGSAGSGLPTARQLEFQLAHAQARDAVHVALDLPALALQLEALRLPLLQLQSQATDRREYLQRPDKGRRLAGPSLQQLSPGDYDLALVIAEGLSAPAIQHHAAALLQELLPRLGGLKLAPLCLVSQGRVAVGDEVAQALNARLVVVLIGERPGLSSPDSLGIYLTWEACVGTTDERRNCISNVRPQGLNYPEAAAKCAWLIREAFRLQLTGVQLKDAAPALAGPDQHLALD